jgi:hypothetical protein
MAQIITNPQPKARFQESTQNVTQHRDMVAITPWQRAMDFGMLQYCSLLAQQVTDGSSAMAVGFKLQGALEFQMTARMLAETPISAQRAAQDQLDHAV